MFISPPRLGRSLALPILALSFLMVLCAGSASAAEPRLVRVLYVEQAPRWEYRFLRNLLQREGTSPPIQLRVLLLDGAKDLAEQDRQMLAEFPTRAELVMYDVVILGDVDPKHPALSVEHQKSLASFVKIKGGSLLVIAGKLHGPRALKGTPLEDVLPVVLDPEAKKQEQGDSFRLVWTEAGRKHPLFRLDKEEKASQELWGKLPEFYRAAEGYRAREGGRVLAVHPKLKSEKAEHPLMVEQSFGEGRTLFLGFDETWRWRAVNQGKQHAKFWIAAIVHLAGAEARDK